MNKGGVELLTCEVMVGRSVDHERKNRLIARALGVFVALDLAVGICAVTDTESAVEKTIYALPASYDLLEVDQETSEGTTTTITSASTTEQGTTRVVKPQSPVTTTTTQSTTTTITLQTSFLPSPETTTTTEHKMSCEQIWHEVTVTAGVPVAPNWGHTCYEVSGMCVKDGKKFECDGFADSNSKMILLMTGDEEDSNMQKKFTVAHEIAHTWQDEFDMWTRESGDLILCHQRTDPRTGQKIADEKDEYAPFCAKSLEKQANNFAFAHSYTSTEHGHKATTAGARGICEYFARFRAGLCKQ